MKILDKLDELRAKATPGPWGGWDGGVTGPTSAVFVSVSPGAKGCVSFRDGTFRGTVGRTVHEEDAERIVLACNAEEALVRVCREADDVARKGYLTEDLITALKALRDLDGGAK